nr:hypothetical protein CFP56_30069 [Quercus suber]
MQPMGVARLSGMNGRQQAAGNGQWRRGVCSWLIARPAPLSRLRLRMSVLFASRKRIQRQDMAEGEGLAIQSLDRMVGQCHEINNEGDFFDRTDQVFTACERLT